MELELLMREMEPTQNQIYLKLRELFSKHGCELSSEIKIYINDKLPYPFYNNDCNTIYLKTPPTGGYYCQFLYQLAHELTHAYIAEKDINHPLIWIDEILSSNVVFYAFEFLNQANIIKNMNYFSGYIRDNFAHFNTSLNCAKQIIKKHLDEFLINHNNVKKAPLIYYIYDNRADFNIWNILQAYKNWRKNYSETKLGSNFSKKEHFSIASKSLSEYLKTYSPDSSSYATLFNCGDDCLNNSSNT